MNIHSKRLSTATTALEVDFFLLSEPSKFRRTPTIDDLTCT